MNGYEPSEENVGLRKNVSPNPKKISPISIFSLTPLCQVTRISNDPKKKKTVSVSYKKDFCHWISKKIGPIVSLGINLD